MGFLAQAFAYLLFMFSKWLFGTAKESFDDYVKRKETEETQKKNLKKYQEAVKKGNADEILEAERDLINDLSSK